MSLRVPAPPLPAEALHLPVEDGPWRMAMALQPCPAAGWLELDDRYPAELAERRHLIATRRAEVIAACPGAEAACAELLAVVADHLVEHHAGWFRRDGAVLHNDLAGEAWDLGEAAAEPLGILGQVVQEDFCLIQPGPGGPVLEGAVLCAPSRWRLSEKIGRNLLAVHGPVPFYAARLGGAVDRFLHHLRPGRIALRMNWSVVDDPALFQPGGHGRRGRDASITPANAPSRLFFRMERQTFRLLPGSGRVAFGIRVHSYPLARLLARPGMAMRLADALRALPPELTDYKGLGAFREALLTCLDEAAAPGPRSS